MNARKRHIKIQSLATLLAATLLALLPGQVAALGKNGVQVDVLVFSQPGADGTNFWQEIRPLPACHAVALRDGSGAEDAFANGEPCEKKSGLDAAFGGFSGASLAAMPAQTTKLVTGNYPVMIARHWKQAAINLSPVLLRGGRKAGERQEVEGTITLADITTRTGSTVTEAQIEFVLTEMEGEKPRHVTLRESRVVKSGELHYFDHPLFGVLVQVTDLP